MISSQSWSVNLLKTNWLFLVKPLKKYQHHQLDKIADQIAQALRQLPREEVASAQNNPAILEARRFLKDIKFESPGITECHKQLLAMKLGISAETFNYNPGFQKFASKCHLERYLLTYKHKLEVDTTTNKISILANGVMTSWEEAQKLINTNPPPSTSKKPSLPWYYGPKGLQNEDMYQWTEFKPFTKEDPAQWGHRYIFEFCSCWAPTPGLNDSHSWLRLRTPEGDVYSVGLYRPQKRDNFDNFGFPLRLKKGHLMQPDVSEFWPWEISAIPVEITKEQFEKMKAKIEEDKRNDNLVFQLFQSNCLLYCKSVANIANIDLPTSQPVVRILTPKSLEPVTDGIANYLPNFVLKICTFVSSLFFNLLQLALGASIVDQEVREMQGGSSYRAHIHSFWDLFRPSKACMHHPHTLSFKVRKWVAEWRAQEIAKSQATNTEAAAALHPIQFKIPNMPAHA